MKKKKKKKTNMGTLERELEKMREYFGSGKTKEACWRESQLKGLRRFLMEKHEDILKALMEDLGKHPIEAFRDEVYIYIFAIFFCSILVFSYNVRINVFFKQY